MSGFLDSGYVAINLNLDTDSISNSSKSSPVIEGVMLDMRDECYKQLYLYGKGELGDRIELFESSIYADLKTYLNDIYIDSALVEHVQQLYGSACPDCNWEVEVPVEATACLLLW